MLIERPSGAHAANLENPNSRDAYGVRERRHCASGAQDGHVQVKPIKGSSFSI